MSVAGEYRAPSRDYVSAKSVSPFPVTNSIAKRIADIAGALFLLTLSLPLIVFIAVIVGADGGPVLYGDDRIGRDRAVFRCLKFRTMHLDAERLLEAHLAQSATARQEWEASCKLRDDPRITAVGRWLRRFSMDELPQLWNVLRGEMSLVGPRPLSASHGEPRLYGRHFELCCQVRPGLTGLWQVSGRNDVPYPRRVAMDVYYVRRWTLAMDLAILMRTVRAVLVPEGSY